MCHFVAMWHWHILADFIMNWSQYLSTMNLGNFVAMWNRNFFGHFYRNFVTNRFRNNVTNRFWLSITVWDCWWGPGRSPAFSLGFGFRFSLGFASPTWVWSKTSI